MAQSNAFKFANNILTNGGYDAADLVGAAGGVNTPNFSADIITGTITATNNVTTKLIFDNELFDTDSAYDTSTGRFTVPSGEAGKYHFTTSFMTYETTANNNITNWGVFIRVNGVTTVFLQQNESASTGGYRINHLNATLNLAVSDYIEVFYKVNTSSGTIQVEVGSDWVRFSGFKLIE
jgi:hypothetical protein